MIRESLQKGSGRNLLTLALALAGGTATWIMWGKISGLTENPMASLQRSAFVAAAFSVTAYNLRTRVIDLILKIEADPTTTNEFCANARECGKKLTNLVLLFTGAAAVMAFSGFFKTTDTFAKEIFSLSTGLFAASIVQFVYILFAFESLERSALDDAEKKAQDREAKRLNTAKAST